MKKVILSLLNILLVIPFLIFFRRGAMVTLYMLPVWFVMTIVNTICAKDIKQILIYNGFLALFATIGIVINGQLYFNYVHWDSIGEVILEIELLVEVVYIAVLTGFEVLIKYAVKLIKALIRERQTIPDIDSKEL